MDKRIMFVSRFRPDAAGTGGQQRRHAMLSALRTVARVDQLILSHRPDDAASDELYLPSLNRPRFALPGALSCVDAKLVGIVQGWSGDSAWLSDADKALLADRIASGRYDILFANRALCGFLLRQALGDRAAGYRILTDLDDLLSDVILAELRTRGRSLGMQTALARLIEAGVVRHCERRTIGASEAVFVCSEGDRVKVLARYPGAEVVVLPNISRAAFLPPPADRDRLRLLFVGSLEYDPNRDGIAWFLDAIWPAARRQFGEGIALTVVGRGTPDLVGRLADAPGVDFHLNVPAIEPYYRDANLCIVPVRYGGGTSIKTIEAMATGRPVLSTPVGVRGLGMIEGQDYLGFADAGGFVAACRDVLEPARYDGLVAAGQALWRERFSQGAVDRILASLVGAG